MEELKQQILTLCNSSSLPLEAVMFVLKDAWRDAEAALRDVKERAKMQPQTEAPAYERVEGEEEE